MTRGISTSLLLLSVFTLVGCANRYDTIIRNGQVIDGTGNPWYYADVGINNGRIAKIGNLKDARAKTEIDAKGLVVAPGFIDVHTHADDTLYRIPRAENFVRDGVTSIVTGNCGGSERDIGVYFARLEKNGVGLNVASLIGHNTVLRAAKGDKAGELTRQQMDQAKAIVRKAMDDGAVGFSTGLIYTPGRYSSTEEIIELQKVVAPYGGIYASHMRSESGNIMNAIDEALRIGREAGTRVEISHFKLPSDVASRIGGSDATLKKVWDARAAGHEVWVDQYPYTASSTSLSQMLPDWIAEGGGDNAKKILSDPKQRDKILKDMTEDHERGRRRKDLSYAVVSSCKAHRDYEGKNIKQITQINKLKATKGDKVELMANDPALPEVTMEEQYRTVIDIYVDGGASCVFHTMNEAEVENILRNPLVSVASDSGVREFNAGVPHPRGYGTNARVLGKYVRERKIISLEEAIRKMTTLPAMAFKLKGRGAVREGNWADITIFNPATVIDRATFEKPHQYAEGIDYVLVNGGLVVDKGTVTGNLPGHALRRN